MQPFSAHTRAVSGFTLVELMIVLSLLAIAAAAAAPALGNWMLRQRIDTQAYALLSTFTYARSEAIRRGTRIAVCRHDGHGQCSTRAQNCAGIQVAANDWACGYLVQIAPFMETGQKNPPQLLRVIASTPGLSITGFATRVLFTPPAGQIIGGFRSFEISARSQSSVPQHLSKMRRCIRIAAGGRARLVQAACQARP